MKKPLRPLAALSALLGLPALMHASISSSIQPSVLVNTTAEPVAPGKFAPAWDSLKQYEVPEWFRDAKFGIWAHWGPQCQPGRGDWYARHMYLEDGPLWGTNVTASHRETYGHPSKFGFKDVIHTWKAAKWDPEKLVALYKRAGAKYFFALANHHDNLDLWDSKYQSWNTLRVGPGKNIIAGWEKAARANGLKFGVSVHASHAWTWYEPSQGADKKGPYSGIPYDGKLTADDGKGTWWEGLDPQELYEQRHAPIANFDDPKTIHAVWDWFNVAPPDQTYCEKFYNRTIDLINKYQPDLIYFDDTALPLWPASDAGLKIAAHFYNQNNAWRGDDGVLFGKGLEADQKECMALDIERGRSHVIEPRPWQTDTCLGDWHYNTDVRDRHGYKSAHTVIHTLIDVVSKNGNLLLSVPLDGDGQPDAQEIAILEGIAAWMQINQEAIHGTRPWKVMGEGPQMQASSETGSGGNFNEGNIKPLGAEDVRFTTKGGKLYAFLMGAPTSAVDIRSLGTAAGLLEAPVASVRLLGSDEKPVWSQSAEALRIEAPASVPDGIAAVFEITLRG